MSDAPPKAPILPPGPEGFSFAWREPNDADLSWEWDSMHFPAALTPLAGDYSETIAQGFEYRYQRLGVRMDILGRVWNGYAYFAAKFGVPGAEVAAEMEVLKQAKRDLFDTAGVYWDELAVPELQATYAWIDGIDTVTSEADELATAWTDAWARTVRAWHIHFFAISAPYQVLNDLADRYEALVPGAPPGDALRLIQGGVSELQDVESGIQQLAGMLRDDAALAAWLRTELAGPEGGAGATPEPFGAALAAFLERHGHLGQGWDDLLLPSWVEEPRHLLVELAKRLEQPPQRAEDRQRRLVEDGERLAAALRERLADRPDELAAFERLLRVARAIGPITERHNYWIDRMAQSHLRRLVMRVADRLVALGVIRERDDVFYLHKAEVPHLLRAPSDASSLVAARRAEYDRQRELTPPPYVGQPPDAGDGPADRFEGPQTAAGGAAEVQGVGASAGIARGPARVALGQADFDRINPGDVIVCPSSNPSWVPLFSIAAGLVTDVGGVLSHAAVVAREFGLPAVVGTRDGTTRIADGQLVEVDGSTGIVRLL
jgi:pyruvate,water dikinase